MIDWFGTEFWSAITGAIVGALAGAIPSWLLARKASDETLKRDQTDRQREERLAAVRFYLALSQVGNDIFSARQQVEEMLVTRPAKRGEKYPTQKRLSVLSGVSQNPANPFGDLDLAFLARPDGIGLINEIELLGRCYETQVTLFNDFKIIKQRIFEIYEQAKNRQENEQGLTTYALDPAHSVILADRESQAEILAVGLVEILRENSQKVHDAARLYDRLAQYELSDLDVPRLDMSRVSERFPDLQ